MALPDRLPEPPDDFEDNTPSSERPSWLVGAEEGAQAEVPGLERSEVKLVRPMAPATSGPASPGAARGPEAPAAPPRPVAWTAAASSMPRLTHVPGTSRRPEPGPASEFEAEIGPPDVLTESAMPAGHAAPAAPARPLEEPWWLVLGERITGDRRLQVLIALLVVALVALVLWPRGGAGVAVKDIRRNPDRWEGQSVTVKGRVGDVFPLGSGYVFNLHQGRDTIVVFTRSRHPERRSHVEVTGEVSAGYLDGRARLAILEAPTSPTP